MQSEKLLWTPKKIYLAGRLDTGEESIAHFAAELEESGHTVLEKWWEVGRLPKPYLDHLETSSSAARAMIRAAAKSDVMILFPDEDILGAAVELGAALASTHANPDKEVIIINPGELDRQSVFYAHPAVVAVRGLEEVRRLEWYSRNI